MSTHLTPTLLDRFTGCTLDEELAVEVAEHLDDCPSCANKAELADPLASVLASVEPPPLPEGLVGDILSALPEDSLPGPWMRTADALVVSLLLAAAGLLFVVAATPGQFLVDASLSSAGSTYAITDLGRVTVVSLTTLAASFFAGLAGLLVWRRWRSRR